jgi:hypothetical protein
MITYTWDIFRLDCAPSENGLMNVVKTIHWVLQAKDENGITASFSNCYPLPEPNPEEFADYSTLTKETVVGWLESNLDMGYLQTRLTTEIELQYNPPITSLPLPWETLDEMIADGYNPDARDGDGDGFVQDGTQWERPVDTQL